MFIRLMEIITKNRIKVISMFEKNCSKIFYTVFWIDPCKIDSLVPII